MKDVAVSAVSDHAAALPNLDIIIRGLLYVYILSLPFQHLLFVERNGFIILVVLLLLWCAVNRRHFFTRTPIDIPLIAFVAWVAFTIPFAAFPLYSFKEFAKLLQQGLIFYVVVYFFKAGQPRTHLIRLLMVVLAVVSVYGIYQFTEMISVKRFEGSLMLIESFMPGEVWLTTYLVMLIPLCVALALFDERPWARRVYAATIAAATLCLLLTYSRAGLLSLLCELAALAWILHRRAIVIGAGVSAAVVVVAAVLLFQYNSAVWGGSKSMTRSAIPIADLSSLKHRLEITEFVTGKIVESPVVGIGYGKDNLKQIYGRAGSGTQPTPYASLLGVHNIYLELALGVGLPGLILFVWLLQRIAARALVAFRSSCESLDKAVSLGMAVGVIGLAVRLTFDQMLIGTLALQFWVLVAMAMVVYTGKPIVEQVADAAR